jgi:uncharacterized membrane protein required for colicin V production
MNWVDIVIAILVLGLGFMGWRNGVIKLIFTLIGGIVGLVLAGQLWEQVADLLPIDNESFAKIAAFVAILAAALIISMIVSKIVKSLLKVLFLGWVDGLAGTAIGLLLGGIAATAVVSAAGIVPSDSVQKAVNESTLAEPLVQNMGIVYTFLPSEFDSVKDLVSKGKDLLAQGTSLLENSGKIAEILSQGTSLLEQAGGLEDLISKAQDLKDLAGADANGVVVGFTGLTAFGGAPLLAVFEDPDGGVLGPLSTNVLTGGFAVLPVEGLTADVAYTMTYYVDGNDNGDCDDDADDVKGTLTLAAGATEAGVTYSGDDGSGDGLCDAF